jgi:putative lipoic acid-binding regulatory protein
MNDLNKRKPVVEYLTKWGYKVIGTDVDKLLNAVEEATPGLKYELTPSNISKGEKYYSLNVTVIVPSEVVRHLVFKKLSEHPDIKMVI